MKIPKIPKKRILAVDDRAAVTNLWRIMLEMTGHYVVQEENHSCQAMQAARRFRPDLLLLDIDMPGVDGPEIARLVRADAVMNGTAIVFLSSLVTPYEVALGKRVEGHPCLSKPTSVCELVQTIEDTLALAC